MSTSSTTSYLIIGAGCFGASTALHLKRAQPLANITLVDRTPFPCPLADGHDLNKVIRAEYEDPFYMKLGMEALAIWKQDPIYAPYFHNTGILFAGTEENGQAVLDNHRKLTGSTLTELITPKEAKERFGGIFGETELSEVTSCTWNPQSGWADAENALRSVIQAAVDLGVRYITSTVRKVLFNHDGSCIGIETSDGGYLYAGKTILCTGAYTAELLANSAPDKPDFQVGGRMTAAAAIMCTFKVPEDQMSKFDSAPIIIKPMGSYPGESIPAGPRGLVKCTHELSFTNNSYHAASKQTISMVPRRSTQMTWSHDVPQGLKDEVAIVKNNIYGNWVQCLEPESYRMCWDAVTPNQDFVICSHPKSENLYIVAGGSFHGWKFLANIGKYVVQMLEGSLDSVAAKKWAWDRNDEGAACGIFWPSRDLSEIAGYEQMNNSSRNS